MKDCPAGMATHPSSLTSKIILANERCLYLKERQLAFFTRFFSFVSCAITIFLIGGRM